MIAWWRLPVKPSPSGNGLKTVILLENFCGLILNIGTCIITIDTILQIFAYPCATRYADFIGFSPEPHLKPISAGSLAYHSNVLKVIIRLGLNSVATQFKLSSNQPILGLSLSFYISNTCMSDMWCNSHIIEWYDEHGSILLRPWSVDSLDGGFLTSPFHTVGRSKIKK